MSVNNKPLFKFGNKPQATEETKVEEKVNEPQISITASELEALLDKKLNEKLQSIQPTAQAERPIEKYAIRETKKIDNNDEIPELENFEVKDRYYNLMDNATPASYYIANRHQKNSPLQFLNKQTNTLHALRYATNQVSFFVDKQSKEDGSVVLGYIPMENGMLFVPKENPTLQKFLAIHPHKDIKFREINHDEENKSKLQDLDLTFKAQTLVRNLDYIEQDAIARLVCSNYEDNWKPDRVKAELFAKIPENPKKYIEYAEDKTLALKGVAKTANSRGYISYGGYRFKDENGEVFLEVGRNENEWEAIATYLLSNEGNQLREYLEDKIK
jgi:hypothetical protein